MKLDQLVLAIVAIFALIWIATLVTGLLTSVPFGVLGLIPVAIVLGILAVVIY